jgi:outer membrane protein OmpA-like peptidoglycan-associated protein
MNRRPRALNLIFPLLLAAVCCNSAFGGCSDRKYLEAEQNFLKARGSGSAFEKIGLYETAFGACPSHGNFARGYYELGKLYYDDRNKDKALEWLAEANRFKGSLLEQSKDDFADTNLLLSNLYKDNGEAELALVHLNIYRALVNRRDKRLETNLIDNSRAFLSVVYSPGTIKNTLVVDKDITPEFRSQVNRLEVYFDIAKSSLDDNAKQRLEGIAEALNAEAFLNNTLVIEGHTDEAGGEDYNCELGKARAKAVLGYLQSKVPVDKVKLTPLSFGKSHPTIPREGHEKKDWQTIDRYNRRVVIWNAGSDSAVGKDIKVESIAPETPCAVEKKANP